MSALANTSVTTEGGVLPPDLLERVRTLDHNLPGLRPEDYGLAPGERLNDAIVRSWTRLSGVWQAFADRLDAAPASETTFESQTRQRWLVPLLQELGFGRLEAERPVVFDASDGKEYPVSHRASGVAMHLIGARVEIDKRAQHGARPAHGMVQEFLNRSDRHMWALVTNGLRIRVLRDSSSLTRQAYCEFDLEVMFRGQEYSDFALCWLVCHASRFVPQPTADDPPSTCFLERWSNQARTDGTRALDQLRGGVEAAIELLGTGFLAEPDNAELRRRLESGELSVDEYHRQLLRLVYRLIFLLVAESRNLLHPNDAGDDAKERYGRWYSLTRIVEISRRPVGSAHGDLWQSLGVVFGALAGPGQPALGLNGLGSFLWSNDAIADLSGAGLSNRALLDAVHKLTTVYESTGRRGRPVPRSVDYRNLGSEELGSIYEALLELHPVIDGRRFSLDTAAGNERKTTGSYYTPTPLIRVLLDSALDPVLDEAADAADPEAAILALKVLDPAAGSGHFLIAAAHRIAHRLASVRSGESEPSPEDLRHALREVIDHCIYGVDVNPMAVELCKVSLWMEATEPGKPLSFLDHHIVCGNSLLGTTPRLLNEGLPDDAFKVLEGDDKAWVSTLKKRNKSERKFREQGAFDFGERVSSDLTELAKGLAELEALPDDSAEAIAEKERAYAELVSSEAAARARLGADAWCAAFVAPKTPDSPALTDEVVRNCGREPGKVPAEVRGVVEQMRDQYRFLHLHITFPDVFTVPRAGQAATNEVTGWSDGFDLVLGNPPWERVKLQEKEFFATRDPAIAAAPNAAARKKLIAALVDEHPTLHEDFLAASRQAAGESHLLRDSGRYPLGGRGDVNTYAVFAELMRTSISPTGRMGVIVPTGIATDDTTKHFFADLVDKGSLASLYDFENRLAVFPGVHRSYKFALLTLSGAARPIAEAEFVFFALAVEDLDDEEKRFTLSPEDFELLNPNTRTCPVFRTRRDAEITKGIYRRVPVLVKEGDPNGNPWGVKFSTMFHMSNDSALFRTRAELEADGWVLHGNHFVRGEDRYLPLYEGRFGHQFDHRFAEQPNGELREISAAQRAEPFQQVEPQYWVTAADFENNIRRPASAWLGFRRVARNTDERTVISAILPFEPASYGWILTTGPNESDLASLAAVYNSAVFDYCSRNALTQPSFPQGTFAQLPAVAPSTIGGVKRMISMLILELSYTAWDLERFGSCLGHAGPPFRWDDERRRLLRAELDALMFRLYGIERDDVNYILDTFPIVKRKDEAEFGEYRTKRLILERYDAMAAADAAGEEYQTALDPPPADPSLCHPESTRPDWARETP